MNRVLTLLTGLLAAAALGQLTFNAGDVNLDAKGMLFHKINPKAKNSDMTFALTGDVRIASKKRGIVFSSQTATAWLTPSKDGKGNDLKSAKATGGVTITQTVVKAKERRSTITSPTANYTMLPTNARVDFTGKLDIASFDGPKETLHAIGSSGSAVIDPNAKKGNGLKSATLRGPVTVTVADPSSPNSTVVATGDRLDIDFAGAAPTLTLVGHVRIVANGKNGFMLPNQARVVLTLTPEGEFHSFESTRSGT